MHGTGITYWMVITLPTGIQIVLRASTFIIIFRVKLKYRGYLCRDTVHISRVSMFMMVHQLLHLSISEIVANNIAALQPGSPMCRQIIYDSTSITPPPHYAYHDLRCMGVISPRPQQSHRQQKYQVLYPLHFPPYRRQCHL